MPEPTPGNEKPLRVRRGRVESVDLYEIKDTELDRLEHGSPADLQLNFAIFLASLAFTAIIALVTATFASATWHTIFIVVTVVGALGSAYLFLSWKRNHTSLGELCREIKDRIPKEGPAMPPPPGQAPAVGPDQPHG